MSSTVHVIGANGRSGAALCRALIREGRTVIPIVRRAGNLPDDIARTCPPPRLINLEDETVAIRIALQDARCIVNTAHARHTVAILAAAPPPAILIGLGSTRKFSRWSDVHGHGVIAGEQALMSCGRAGIMLHPTMIYGASGEDNVQRLARLLRFLPVVPLPEKGRALVQPIYQEDVTRSLLAAVRKAIAGELTTPRSIVIAGPAAMPYRAFVAAVSKAAGLRDRRVLSVPAGVLMTLAPMTAHMPFLPDIRRDEIRRLLEDKAFDVTPMRQELGVAPLSLEDGLSRLFRSRFFGSRLFRHRGHA